MQKKGEAELENSPVDCFPAEPAHDVRGTSALRGPERSEDPTKALRAEETLNPRVQGRIGANTKKLGSLVNRVLLC